ncbi:MAG TPA: GIY-YIG nuclease family protein [Caulobacter sp.]|nr:GIY-YIG nuclease family protein [Caulobacter sp.]
MKQDRKAQLRAYRERPKLAGAFAVRCTTTGEAWVGTTADVSTRQNGLWAALRMASYPLPALVAAWKQEGEGAFAFEVLETLPDEARSPYVEASQLKDLAAAWRERLGAGKL